MTTPADLAREAFDTICEAMPSDLQQGRAPVEARRLLAERLDELPVTARDAARDELETLIEERFGSQELPLRRNVPKLPQSDNGAASLEDDLSLAVADAYATTFDGSEEQADVLSRRAFSECERVFKSHRLGFLDRWRARRLCRKLIAEERKRLFD